MVKRVALFLAALWIASCSSAVEAPSSLAMVTVNATSAAQPWLTELYTCADQQSVILNLTSESPQIQLRIGEPEALTGLAFQIDEEEILIVTNRLSPVQNLTLDEARSLFAGQGDPSAQVWVYASDEDVQVSFDQLVMNGRGVSFSAGIAAGPQEMSDLLNKESNAVGILPRHWKVGDVRDVYSAGKVPVLAIVNGENTETIQSLLACLSQ
jgi:hypothetical protein